MTQEEAIKTAQQLAAERQVFVTATVDSEGRPKMRWMGGYAKDPHSDLVYYAVCGSQSRKMAHIRSNPAMQVMFTSEDYRCVVTVDGTASVVEDMAVKRMVWDAIPGCAEYFPGPEDPSFGVIRFRASALEVLCTGESHEPVRVELG